MKAFKRNVERIPNNQMLGTKKGVAYEWSTWQQVNDKAIALSHGINALNLAPDIEAEGTTYRFIGIQSKNRAEWVEFHIANLHQSVTSVAFFDTLGPDAQKFIINQTEMTTMVVSIDYLTGLATLKKSDSESGENKL